MNAGTPPLPLRDRPEARGFLTREEAGLHRRERAYRGGRPSPDVRGRTVILVDDGLATGASMRAAAGVRRQGAANVVVAVPVASIPEPFHAVGLWYRDFSETSDDEVRDTLARAWTEAHGVAAP